VRLADEAWWIAGIDERFEPCAICLSAGQSRRQWFA